MRVNEIMTSGPACCGPNDRLTDTAKAMLVHDCGSMPVVDGESKKVVGVVTDRDITIRAVAAGRDPASTMVSEVMSHPVAMISDESDVTECMKLMEQNRIRRAPVIDHAGRLVGIVAQADMARCAPEQQSGEMLREISKSSIGGLSA